MGREIPEVLQHAGSGPACPGRFTALSFGSPLATGRVLPELRRLPYLFLPHLLCGLGAVSGQARRLGPMQLPRPLIRLLHDASRVILCGERIPSRHSIPEIALLIPFTPLFIETHPAPDLRLLIPPHLRL